MKTRRLLFVLLILVLAVVGMGGLWVWQAKRQYALNRQLIAALVNHDHKTALALVNAGADPNTRQEATPTPTLPQLLRQLLHRSPPPANNSSTAFQFACGSVLTELTPENLTAHSTLDDAPLVQAMLVHGANVRATDGARYTALFYAILWNHPRGAQLLLDNGANVNVFDKFGRTPLMVVAPGDDVDIARRVLEHGASVTLTDIGRYTALHYAILGRADSGMIRLLLEHGADPNARNAEGDTPLRLAQQYHRPDLVRLLRGRR